MNSDERLREDTIEKLKQTIKVDETMMLERQVERNNLLMRIQNLRLRVKGRKPTATEKTDMGSILRDLNRVKAAIARLDSNITQSNDTLQQLDSLRDIKRKIDTDQEIARNLRKLNVNPDKVEDHMEKHQEIKDSIEESVQVMQSFTPVVDIDNEIENAFSENYEVEEPTVQSTYYAKKHIDSAVDLDDTEPSLQEMDHHMKDLQTHTGSSIAEQLLKQQQGHDSDALELHAL